ncbi:MAG: Holliday junction branch migration protein RuvA [Deltaproteobacteria bacterium]|nr:Holliday junction branch migration protein RuvA [Deltaproteobacteria bacterium]
MISLLRGKAAFLHADSITLDVNGVGYLVHISKMELPEIILDQEYTLQISTIVREDAITLFGFQTSEQREVFDILRSVNKVGPKLAMGILGSISVPDLASAVQSKNTVTLSKIPGIGKKTAERMCLELKNKLSGLAITIPTTAGGLPMPERKKPDPLQLALAQLDYRKSEIDVVLSSGAVPSMEEASIEERLRAALSFLAKQP